MTVCVGVRACVRACVRMRLCPLAPCAGEKGIASCAIAYLVCSNFMDSVFSACGDGNLNVRVERHGVCLLFHPRLRGMAYSTRHSCQRQAAWRVAILCGAGLHLSTSPSS